MHEYIRTGVLFTNSLQWGTWPALRSKLDAYFGTVNSYSLEQILKERMEESGVCKRILLRLLIWAPPLATAVSWLRSSLSLASISPKRIVRDSYNQLAPADDTVQGPHQEAMPYKGRMNFRHVVFACEEPASEGGATALFDMCKAWELLPTELKDELSTSFFKYPLASYIRNYADLIPCAVKCDISGKACLQFFGFGRGAAECVSVYRALTGKQVVPDPYQYGISIEEDMLLVDSYGEEKPFIGPALTTVIKCIYTAMITHHWEKGDVLVVDNVRWSHARLEGVGTQRKIIFTAYGPSDGSDFDITRLDRP
eukprot:NODE_12689_length_1209_cov_3.137708.p1 GENE.NODE_12689_length_1209_cov_3.137708~~NODE_12689_length_1209_cov_3.137708.p1  ORF type:complete len:311 (-),score=28.46 NODE_12689_length_1209_cov_3.137708:275-1207(-)